MNTQTIKYYYTYLLLDIFHTSFRSLTGYTFIALAIAFHLFGRRKQCVKYLMTANRFGYSSTATALFKKRNLFNEDDLFSHVTTGVSIHEAATRSIVIRWPKYNDGKIASKGILIIKFTHIFSYYLLNININFLT